MGNSVIPLLFLAASAVLNIGFDLWFVLGLHKDVASVALATVIAQYLSGIGIAVYTLIRYPQLRPAKGCLRFRFQCVREIASFSIPTCIQQSVMNLGILMVQGLVNGFGSTIIAAFAAAVKIDAFAYMPVQDFGNAFSTFDMGALCAMKVCDFNEEEIAVKLGQVFAALVMMIKSGQLNNITGMPQKELEKLVYGKQVGTVPPVRE